MSYTVLIEKKALSFLEGLPEKSQRIIRDKCNMLVEDPFPGHVGDKELLHLDYKLYRLHLGRSYTIFYQILEDEKVIKILEIMTIEQAHKKYGRI